MQICLSVWSTARTFLLAFFSPKLIQRHSCQAVAPSSEYMFWADGSNSGKSISVTVGCTSLPVRRYRRFNLAQCHSFPTVLHTSWKIDQKSNVLESCSWSWSRIWNTTSKLSSHSCWVWWSVSMSCYCNRMLPSSLGIMGNNSCVNFVCLVHFTLQNHIHITHHMTSKNFTVKMLI